MMEKSFLSLPFGTYVSYAEIYGFNGSPRYSTMTECDLDHLTAKIFPSPWYMHGRVALPPLSTITTCTSENERDRNGITGSVSWNHRKLNCHNLMLRDVYETSLERRGSDVSGMSPSS